MKQTRAGHVFWSGLEAALSALFSFASAFILARIVGPTEVGIGAAVVAVHVLLWVVVNALFADPLVQRETVDEATLGTAFMASVAVGCIAAGLQAALGILLAWSFHDHRLTAMSLALAAALPLVGAGGPIQGMLTRNRGYRQLAWRTLVGQGAGTLAGLAGAFIGAGAWALVAQQLVTSSAGAIVLLVHCPTRPRRLFSSQRLRELLWIGLPLTVSTLLQHGRYRVFALLIGGTAGAAALGQVHMAFRLVDAVRELAFTAQWRLMLPVLSERQNDFAALHAAVDRCLAWSGLLAFPLCAVMALAIQPIVAALLGPIWQPAGEAALPLIALTAWLFLAFPAGVAVIARGEARYVLVANLAGVVATVAGVLLVRPTTPLAGVLVWLGAQIFVSPYILAMNARVLHTSIFRQLRAGIPLLTTSALAAVVAFSLPRLLGEAHSPVWLLFERLSVVAIVGIVCTLLAGTLGLLIQPGAIGDSGSPR